MNILRNSELVLGAFDSKYRAYKAMRIEVVEGSIIRICGLRRFHGGFFDVYYVAVPVFSGISLDDHFLDDASAAPVSFGPMPVSPSSDSENAVISAASEKARIAFDKLNGIGSLEDLVSFYKNEVESLLDKGISTSTRCNLNDAMIYLGRYDELESLLERCLTVAVKTEFNTYGVPFPDDGNWRKYLPTNMEAARNEFEEELFSVNEAYWADLREQLSRKDCKALNDRLLDNYYANRKQLKKTGITLSDQSLRIIKEQTEKNSKRE